MKLGDCIDRLPKSETWTVVKLEQATTKADPQLLNAELVLVGDVPASGVIPSFGQAD